MEYFTIGHPQLINTDSPTLLGLFWGVAATWWVGLLLGMPLAIAARSGRRPRRDARSLVRPLLKLATIMAILAFVAGIIGAILARSGVVFLTQLLASRVPTEKHVLFLADLWAHNSSYLVGFIGGLVVIVRTWRSRFEIMKDEG